MSADLAFATTPSKNPFETARLSLIKRLLAMKAPKAYPLSPSPFDHEGVAAHLREAAAIFDEWLAAIGFQVADNAVCDIDMRVFEGAFTGGIDGNATFECMRAAETLLEERAA